MRFVFALGAPATILYPERLDFEGTMRESLQTSAAKQTVLLVPGIGNSGLTHWQSLWEKEGAPFVRVQQRNWDLPVCSEWREPLEDAVRSTAGAVFIVAHSLGCLLVVHWLARTSLKVNGVMFVAVPNTAGPNFPHEARGFDEVPSGRLACPSILIASTNDPYGDINFASNCAFAWGSRFVNLGPVGHINAASGLGAWSDGRIFLRELMGATSQVGSGAA